MVEVMSKMLKLLRDSFAICKLDENIQVDFSNRYTFFARTDDEVSLVCPYANIPSGAATVNYGWRGFKIEGQLDFSLVGVLAEIAKILAQSEISIFVVSTYNTDYIFVKEDRLESSLKVLGAADYQIEAE